ncbi:hypothetical protein LTR08_004548 [Meristemomyces frigidus]|nr:hypothetical protein LTR08_004548 [Meristemomyces frigidus]
MPSSDYGNAVGGGLKLKGGAKDAGVKKHKKKAKAKVVSAGEGEAGELAGVGQEGIEEDGEAKEEEKGRAEREEAAEARERGKTEAQRRHEERKRKRLEERLQRDGGVKTHKEKVEELNKYLSKLSEHHDMPRIGPG